MQQHTHPWSTPHQYSPSNMTCTIHLEEEPASNSPALPEIHVYIHTQRGNYMKHSTLERLGRSPSNLPLHASFSFFGCNYSYRDISLSPLPCTLFDYAVSNLFCEVTWDHHDSFKLSMFHYIHCWKWHSRMQMAFKFHSQRKNFHTKFRKSQIPPCYGPS